MAKIQLGEETGSVLQPTNLLIPKETVAHWHWCLAYKTTRCCRKWFDFLSS